MAKPTPNKSANKPIAITNKALKSEASCEETDIILAFTLSSLFSVINATPGGLRVFSINKTATKSNITNTLGKNSINKPLTIPTNTPIIRVIF